MSRYALGLVETYGLIAAIEATDAAAKAAGVVVASVELTDAAFLTLKIEGELGAVQASVEAAATAAEKVGGIVAVTVIPNPDDGLGVIIPCRRYISKYHPDDTRPMLDYHDFEPDLPVSRASRDSTGGKPRYNEVVTLDDLNAMTVAELRKYARTLKDLPMKGREISKANKKQLIAEIKKLMNLE